MDNSVVVTGDLYHVTNSENILKYGLIPKSEKKKNYHPHRVYLSRCIEDSLIILKQFQNLDKIKNHKKNYDILKIDTSNLKSFNFNGKLYDVVFYDDTNSNGVYTNDRILPENITLYKNNII